jgi:hypothetical protein
VVPDSYPSALIDSLGFVDIPSTDRHFVRGILMVGFEPTIPQAQRQAAIDQVRGVVVGGKRQTADEGYYLVRLPWADTYEQLEQALATLLALPQVEIAMELGPNGLGESSYLTPNDGAAEWRNWHTDRTLASGQKWALEAINAPLAWGCSVGSETVKIGLVDPELHINVPGLAGNVLTALSSVRPDEADMPSLDHGTRVASVIGAVGNDNVGMTGVMWKAGLMLRDSHTDVANPNQLLPLSRFDDARRNEEDHLVQLGMDGAVIINVSRSVKMIAQYGIDQPDSNNAVHRNKVEPARLLMRRVIRRLRSAGKRPLFVIAAGNEPFSTYWAGYAAVRTDYPDQVIVVGASTPSHTRA